jgi:hypothetical protein
MPHILSDEAGIRYTVGGFITWFISFKNNIDVTEMLGFVGLVIGLLIQFAAHRRNKKADERARQQDERAKLQHELQMRVLQKELSGE